MYRRNVANPMAMILACGGLFSYIDDAKAKRVSHAIYEGTFEAVNDGMRTADLGGNAQIDEFTNEVIRRVKLKLDVWSALG